LNYQINEISANKDITIKTLHYSDVNVTGLDLSCLNELELIKFKSYGSSKRKLEFYFSRVLWLTFNQNQNITYKTTGKPIVKYGFLSMSHSHQYVVICFSERIELGIDIELISEKINKVKSKFLHPKDKYKNLIELTQLWTIKEAFYKLFDGDGIFLMDDVYTEVLHTESNSEVFFDDRSLKAKSHSFFIEKDFIITYCILKK